MEITPHDCNISFNFQMMFRISLKLIFNKLKKKLIKMELMIMLMN